MKDDIASFLISEHSHFVYIELAQKSGELCGSTSINRELYKLMQERFGDAFSSLPSWEIGPGSRFMDKFQKFKCPFTGFGGQGFIKLHLEMAIPGRSNLEWYDQRNNVLVSNADLKTLIEPAIQMTIQTLANHINKANSVKQHEVINKILLVGGFSFSPYLHREVQRCFPNIPVIQNKKYASTAVTRGAVLWGSETFQQQSMFSPCHYGSRRFLLTNEAFNPRGSLVHADFNLGISTDPIEWMVKKGDHMRLDEPTRCRGLLLHGQGDSLTKTIDIYSSDNDQPPTNIGELCARDTHTMVLDLSMIDLNSYQLSEQEGRYMRLIQCTFYV